MISEWRVVDYEDAMGGHPIRDFVNTLTSAEQGRLKTRLAYIAKRGPIAGKDVISSVQGGKQNDPRRKLWELRLPHSPNNPRILLFAAADRTLVLLHGFKKLGKANDKIPKRDIDIAVGRMIDHNERQSPR